MGLLLSYHHSLIFTVGFSLSICVTHYENNSITKCPPPFLSPEKVKKTVINNFPLHFSFKRWSRRDALEEDGPQWAPRQVRRSGQRISSSRDAERQLCAPLEDKSGCSWTTSANAHSHEHRHSSAPRTRTKRVRNESDEQSSVTSFVICAATTNNDRNEDAPAVEKRDFGTRWNAVRGEADDQPWKAEFLDQHQFNVNHAQEDDDSKRKVGAEEEPSGWRGKHVQRLEETDCGRWEADRSSTAANDSKDTGG